MQVLMGIICVTFGSILISLDEQGNGGSGIAFIGYGIWIGIYVSPHAYV